MASGVLPVFTGDNQFFQSFPRVSFVFHRFSPIFLLGVANNDSFVSRKGIAQSALPYRRTVPTWLKLTVDDVKEHISKLGRKGLTPSQIGKTYFSYIILSMMEYI